MSELYGTKTRVFGHRGARASAPENTMSAFQLALDMGAEGIELDVMLSADGVPVVCHDFTLERTTDGSGKVRDHTVVELQALDAGAHYSAAYQGERLPTLAQVLERFGHQLYVNIELKSASAGNDGLETAVVDLVRRYNMAERIIFSSFNPLSLWRAKRLAPHMARGLLYSFDMPLLLRQAWAAPLLGLDAVHPGHSMIDQDYLRWARRKGYHINTWTVNEPDEMIRLIDLGVDILITDRPALARQVVDDRWGGSRE